MSIFSGIKKYEKYNNDIIDIDICMVNPKKILLRINLKNPDSIDDITWRCFDIICEETWLNYYCEVRKTINENLFHVYFVEV